MKRKNCIRKFDVIVFILFNVLCVIALARGECVEECASLEKTSQSDNISDVSDTDYTSLVSFTSEIDVFKHLNDTELLRFATPCETPNHEVAYCQQISTCPILDAVKGKIKYEDFVTASKCGPTNENPKNFKVCCGKYNNFRNSNTKQGSNKITTTTSIPEIVFALPQQCGTQRRIMRGRIVGGTEAVLGEYPWMARIIHKNKYGHKSYGCAGFLIHPKYVATAAHCIKSDSIQTRGEPYSVLLGEHNVTTLIDCSPGGTFCAEKTQAKRISKVIVHENYSKTSKNHHNDIALISLNSAVRLSEYVQPICLLDEEAPEVKKYYISGWGKTETEQSSKVKLRVDLVPYERERCKDQFQVLDLEINESQICAGGEKSKDSCNGDSGGPLMITNGTHHFASGLVSYGVGCGMQNWPGVYTSVPYYVNWIKKHMVEINTRSRKIKKHRKKNKILFTGFTDEQTQTSI
ncbi:unnamed protein product [Ceutorhynchus assimilis]|uniref:CLIP domain-containing serine protease n=1 Tax=Ceutorhynchus assimilis TaxID=467358 RepID=A0A9N9QQ71_9CUCU|nr:unnamed protein product [Ceutorhynchus assimilis]